MARKEHRLTEVWRVMENYERPADMGELLRHQAICEELSENVSPEHVKVLNSMESAWEYAFDFVAEGIREAGTEYYPSDIVAFFVREPDTENKRQMLENVEHLYDYITVTDPANSLNELHVLVER